MNIVCGVIRMAKFFCVECAGEPTHLDHYLTGENAPRYSETGLKCDVCGAEIFPKITKWGTLLEPFEKVIQTLNI